MRFPATIREDDPAQKTLLPLAVKMDQHDCDLDTLIEELDLLVDMIATTSPTPPPRGLAFSASGVFHMTPD